MKKSFVSIVSQRLSIFTSGVLGLPYEHLGTIGKLKGATSDSNFFSRAEDHRVAIIYKCRQIDGPYSFGKVSD